MSDTAWYLGYRTKNASAAARRLFSQLDASLPRVPLKNRSGNLGEANARRSPLDPLSRGPREISGNGYGLGHPGTRMPGAEFREVPILDDFENVHRWARPQGGHVSGDLSDMNNNARYFQPTSQVEGAPFGYSGAIGREPVA